MLFILTYYAKSLKTLKISRLNSINTGCLNFIPTENNFTIACRCNVDLYSFYLYLFLAIRLFVILIKDLP